MHPGFYCCLDPFVRFSVQTAVNETKSTQVKNFISTLILLLNHLRLYESANKVIDLTTERTLGFLEPLLADGETLTIYIGRHAFIYEEQFIERSNQLFEAFASRLFQHGIAAVSFTRGVTGAQVHTFLRLVGRKPNSNWDEGGVEAALQLRNISNISVQEMSELDFSLGDETPEEVESEEENSPLWQRFALAIVQGLHVKDHAAGKENFLPKKLAEAINVFLEQHDGSKDEMLAKDLSRFLLSLKQEKVRIYRTATLNSLVDLVNALSPRVRNLFLHNVFNLSIDADLSEGLLRGMSDQVIMDALHNVSLDQGYAPPVVLQLLGRLATERGLALPQLKMTAAGNDTSAERIAELFREDDFDKYVPKLYQKALLSIIKSKELPPQVSENLSRLKRTLEQQAIDHHMGEILMQILQAPVEVQDLGLLSNNLRETIDFYLQTHNYAKIKGLLALCRREQLWGSLAAEIFDCLSTSRFSTALLNDLNGTEREKNEASLDLIMEIGEPFIAPLLDRLSIETNRAVRRNYLNVLTRLGEACLSQTVNRLADSRWFVVRNMIFLLREMGNPDVLQYVRPCIQHKHPKVSQEALKTCLIFRDKEATPFLLSLLKRENESELMQAVSQAAMCDDPAVFTRLVAMLQEGSVLNFRLDLKRAIVRSLASSAAKRSLPVFAGILGSHNLFHPKQLETLKLEVVGALEKIPDDGAKRLLREQTRSDYGEVAQAAEEALARSNGRKT